MGGADQQKSDKHTASKSGLERPCTLVHRNSRALPISLQLNVMLKPTCMWAVPKVRAAREEALSRSTARTTRLVHREAQTIDVIP